MKFFLSFLVVGAFAAVCYSASEQLDSSSNLSVGCVRPGDVLLERYCKNIYVIKINTNIILLKQSYFFIIKSGNILCYTFFVHTFVIIKHNTSNIRNDYDGKIISMIGGWFDYDKYPCVHYPIVLLIIFIFQEANFTTPLPISAKLFLHISWWYWRAYICSTSIR